jgi:hypothetical protein
MADNDKKVGFYDEEDNFHTFRFTRDDLTEIDGCWRQVLREWLKDNILYGEYVKWGSSNAINATITIKQLQDLVMEVAAAVINENKKGEDE